MRTIDHRIAGSSAPSSGGYADINDPSTGGVVGRYAIGTAADVDAAVTAATGAFASWRDTSLSARQQILFAYRQLLRDHVDDLAALITAEHGKTLDDARGEVARGIEVVEYACAGPELMKGEFTEQASTGVDIHSLRQPVGVCAGITPFNFPVMVPLWMIPMAVVTGNAFILKPSERDPSASVLLADLFDQAGLPAGVLNVVQGGKETVDALLEHPGVAAVSFVGSTPVAEHVYVTAAATGKRVQALGGAKNHIVVLPDADLEAAADAVVSAAYGSAGERCMAASVAVAVGEAGDALVPLLKERIGALRVGPGTDPDVDMGPLITAEHRDRVAGYVQAGVDAGAEIVADGRDLVDREGYFLGPCLLDRVTPEMDVYRDEIFGPVLSIVRTGDMAEALELIRTNQFGNGAAVFTRSGAAARAFSREVSAGMVGVNVPIPVPMSFYSFGGWKSSLLGDTHVYGPDAVRFYTAGKVVTSRWPDDDGGLQLNFTKR
jgi:malonate-semialdehyde dehydrogenase (acetylating)/methylmalonate-semialdehyde dehydrogenase